VTSIAFGQLKGRPVIATGSNDNTVRLWDAAGGTPIGDPFTGHTNPVTSIAFGQLEGRPVIATGSHDRTVRLWETPSRRADEGCSQRSVARLVIDVAAAVLAIAFADPGQVVAGTATGLVSMRVRQ
jgi:WD40 repeat protein